MLEALSTLKLDVTDSWNEATHNVPLEPLLGEVVKEWCEVRGWFEKGDGSLVPSTMASVWAANVAYRGIMGRRERYLVFKNALAERAERLKD